MGDGLGTYIKINNAIIKEQSIINIGNSYLAFSFNMISKNNKEDISKKLLFLKIFNENKEFHPIILGKNKNVYLIGRSKDSDIIIEDDFLSKINCFLYNNNSNCNIQDGDQNGIKSTNGTWLYASEDFEIFDDMVFRSNKYNFYCKFSSNL